MMTKDELRKHYRKKRNQLTVTEKTKLDDLLLIQLQTVQLPFIQALLSYWPIEENNEPDTHLFTDYLGFCNPGLAVAYPKTDFTTNEMYAFLVNDETSFVKNNYNISEPESSVTIAPDELDMVFVPLLAVDRSGFRVGYGKGFYDKYLAGCDKGCIKIGFSYFEPVEEIRDKHDFDVPLNLCITPTTTYVF